MNRRSVAAAIFFTFFFLGYVAMGYIRHDLYSEKRQHYLSECLAQLDKGTERPMGWEDFSYLGSTEAVHVIADPVFQNEMYTLYEAVLNCYCQYQSEVLPPVLEECDHHGWSLWGAHKGWTIFHYQLLSVHAAGGIVYNRIGPYSPEDWGGSLAESIVLWEASGGQRQGNWMETYKQTPQYESWINQIFTEIYSPKESRLYEAKSLEEYYDESIKPLELPLFTRIFCGDILKAEQRAVEVVYNQYKIQEHKKDIVRGGVYAWITQFGGSLLDSADERDFDAGYILRSREFPFTEFVIDMCIITSLSLLLTFLVTKKILPRTTL